MRLNTLFFSLTMSLFIAAPAMALPNVELGGGDIAVGQTLKLSLDKLVHTVYYSIECDLVDANGPGSNAKFNLDEQSQYPDFGNVTLNNGSVIGSGAHTEGYLTLIHNKLDISWMQIHSENNYLVFNNMGPSDKITVANCVAIAPEAK